MADLLLDVLPGTVWEGRKINSDFRPMVWLANQYLRGAAEKDPLGFTLGAFQRFYGEEIPTPQSADAFQSMLRFYAGGEAATPEARRSTAAGSCAAVAFDYASDAPYIVAAFRQTYGIDLTMERLHWWTFRALFLGLPEDTLMHKIMHWRTADLTAMSPEERRFYEERRELFALPQGLKGGAPRAVSVAEHDAAFLARFQQR